MAGNLPVHLPHWVIFQFTKLHPLEIFNVGDGKRLTIEGMNDNPKVTIRMFDHIKRCASFDP